MLQIDQAPVGTLAARTNRANPCECFSIAECNTLPVTKSTTTVTKATTPITDPTTLVTKATTSVTEPTTPETKATTPVTNPTTPKTIATTTVTTTPTTDPTTLATKATTQVTEPTTPVTDSTTTLKKTTTPSTTSPSTGPVTQPTQPPRVCDCSTDICVVATSGASERCGDKYWPGHEIEILQNNNVIGKIPSGFEHYKLCIFNEKVDIKSDVFELRRTGNDGVS